MTTLARLACIVTDRSTAPRSHELRVVDPETQAEVFSSAVNLGSAPAARRTSRAVARLWCAGGRVEVRTAHGWEERAVIVGRDGGCYLRAADWQERAVTQEALRRLAPRAALRVAA